MNAGKHGKGMESIRRRKMMNMSGHENMETLEQTVSLWLERREIPQQNYRNLPPVYKGWLRDQVCTRTSPLSDRQLRDLYRKLCSPETVVGRESIDPVDFVPPEELEKFFTPLAPSEKLSYWERF